MCSAYGAPDDLIMYIYKNRTSGCHIGVAALEIINVVNYRRATPNRRRKPANNLRLTIVNHFAVALKYVAAFTLCGSGAPRHANI